MKKIYRIEIERKDKPGTTIGPFLASIYMKELEPVTWQWKNLLEVVCEEPHGVTPGYLIGCTTEYKMLQWSGGRWAFEELVQAGFKLVEIEIEEANVNEYPEIEQCSFHPSDIINKKQITFDDLTERVFGVIAS